MSVRSKPQPAVRKMLAAAAITGVLALGLAACGGGDSSGGGTAPEPAHQPREWSVGEGDAAAPPIAAEVTAGARAAGCTLRAFPSEGRGHVEEAPTYRQSLPPTSGPHNPVWAEWGIYDAPVPAQFQVHNLEHGGVIVHLGDAVPADAAGALRALWGDEPAYMLIVPRSRRTPSS